MSLPDHSPRRFGRPLRLAGLVLLVAAASALLLFVTRPRLAPASVATAVADSTCLSCHRDKAAYEGTAHRQTSSQPSRATIHGSFRDGENLLLTSNPYVRFRMDSTDTGFYQTALFGTLPDTSSRRERFAFVVGSGRKGQTYLYRHDDGLFELPISFWTGLGKWVNSPGYRDGGVDFDRPATPRCLECHATAFETVADPRASNRYRASEPVLGITCEKCHASGREHVQRQRSSMHAVRGAALVDPERLSRARQLDACGLCHGGVGEPKAAAFTYVPGTPLREHLVQRALPPGDDIDVHGNQVALLARSRCFQSSRMTCSTCHDVHRPQRDTVALSGRCLTCHQEQSCKLFPAEGHALAGRCVDCHMPRLPSRAIISDHDGKREQPLVRTHWIKVYPRAVTSAHSSAPTPARGLSR